MHPSPSISTPIALEIPPYPLSDTRECLLPQTPLYSVEYPGYVCPSSVPIAMKSLGGKTSIESAFRSAASKTESLIELDLRTGQPFAHPIPGDVVGTNNILLKVVKRRRKRRLDQDWDDGAIGEYTAKAIGIIPKTARFRSEYYSYAGTRSDLCRYSGMVDYQYQPDMNDPVAKLRVAMDNMDGKFSPCPVNFSLEPFRSSPGLMYICYSRRKSGLHGPFRRG